MVCRFFEKVILVLWDLIQFELTKKIIGKMEPKYSMYNSKEKNKA